MAKPQQPTSGPAPPPPVIVAGGGADAEADAYFHSLIARVDEAVGDTAGPPASPAMRLLNHHSATAVCFKDPFDPFPPRKRCFVLSFSVLGQFFLSACMAKPYMDLGLYWFLVTLLWLPFYFVVRTILRRPDWSWQTQAGCWPWGAAMLSALLVMASAIIIGVDESYENLESSSHFGDALRLAALSWFTNLIAEAVALQVCLATGNPCMRTTHDDSDYLRETGLTTDDMDTYVPPSTGKLPGTVDL